MNTELMKAVERLRLNGAVDTDTYHAIVDGVRDLEAENAELREKVVRYITQASDYSVKIADLACRAMAAERRVDEDAALLRECLAVMDLHPDIHARITAHLGADHE
jgi:hypothetical protein